MKKNDFNHDHKLMMFFSDKQWSFHVPKEIEKMSDIEKMQLIRSRKRRNQEKVRKFFGADLRIDVSLSMIKRYKLPAMLESDLPLAYFICYLIKCQSVENLVTKKNRIYLNNMHVFSFFVWKLKSSMKQNLKVSRERKVSPKEFSILSWKTAYQCK